VISVVVDSLSGDGTGPPVAEGRVVAEVAAQARVGRATDLEPDALARVEALRRSPHIDLDTQAAIGLRGALPWPHTEHAIADVTAAPRMVYQAESGDKVGVAQA
jgi:hypothetical protein